MSKQLQVAPPPSRVGDRDRNKTSARLGQAFAQGYLQINEYEERVQHAFTRRTQRPSCGNSSPICRSIASGVPILTVAPPGRPRPVAG